MGTTGLCYMWHHSTEASRLHSYCSNVVQISMCGTGRVRPHCIGHCSKPKTCSRIITLMPYSSYLSMVRTLTHWIITTRLRSIWHHNTAASEPRGYCSSIAQMSISRTTTVIPPPKLRQRRVTRRSRGCCRSILRVRKSCDSYQYNSLNNPAHFVVFYSPIQ